MGNVHMNAQCTFSIHAAKHADDGFLAESLQRHRVYACGGHPDGGSFQDELTTYNKFAGSDQVKGTDPPLLIGCLLRQQGIRLRQTPPRRQRAQFPRLGVAGADPLASSHPLWVRRVVVF
jgi:hypothetical protein